MFDAHDNYFLAEWFVHKEYKVVYYDKENEMIK